MTEITRKRNYNKIGHFKQKLISDINIDDNKISILGHIIEINETDYGITKYKEIIVDDGTGIITCYITDDTKISPRDMELKEGLLVRTFGFIEFYNNNDEISFDYYISILQILSKLNLDLYKKVLEIKKELGDYD